MKIKVLSFDQPAGTFYFGSAPAIEVARISTSRPRLYNPITRDTEGGIQREKSTVRINEISEYALTRDASFPTPVILALKEGSYTLVDDVLTIEDAEVADVVDGQHRIEGLKRSAKLSEFELPVVFLLEPTEEEKALIFATINGKQTPVPASVVYDLFGVTKSRSPQKTAHEIARALNTSEDSPWKGKLKMLGKKSKGSDETLSQGTFIKFLLPLISSDPDADMEKIKNGQHPTKNPNLVFNEYFYENQDGTILKILMNLFNAAEKIWPDEWEDSAKYILTKTTGYTGIMKSMPDLIKFGKELGYLSTKYFALVFQHAKDKMSEDNVALVNADFSSSAVGEAKLKRYITQSIEELSEKDKLDLQKSLAE